MVQTVIGSIVLGLVSTLGDFAWEAMHLRHRVVYGLVHGAVICLSVGTVVAWPAGRPLVGGTAGLFIGVAAAGLFYVLAPFMRYSAMFPAWMFFWLCFALLQEQLQPARDYRFAAVRGLAAAVASGLAFYAISGIWTQPSPGGPDYMKHFFSWTIAFLPGFAALFIAKQAPPVGTS